MLAAPLRWILLLSHRRSAPYVAPMSFKEFGLLDEVVQGVSSMGYVDPTPIQLRAFPIILSGKDMMGSRRARARPRLSACRFFRN
jgi:hypothetical protein